MENLILSNIFNTTELTVKEFKEKLLSFEKDRTVVLTINDDMYKTQFTGDSFIYKGRYSGLALEVKSVSNKEVDKTVGEVIEIIDNMMEKFKERYKSEFADVYASYDKSFSSQCYIADVAEIKGQIYIVLGHD